MHNFLLVLLNIVFNLSTKWSEGKKVCIIHRDDIKVIEALCELYVCQSLQLFLICKSVTNISSLKYSVKSQKQEEEHS